MNQIEETPIDKNYHDSLSNSNLLVHLKKDKEEKTNKEETIDWKAKYEKLLVDFENLQNENESLTQLCQDLSEIRSKLEDKINDFKKIMPNSPSKITVERIPINTTAISEFFFFPFFFWI